MRSQWHPAVLLAFILLTLLPACQAAGPDFEIAYEDYQLDNGLTVVLHEDKSDPIVAVAVLYHVGSGREEVGKTGFAHLFEHMMFQSSQHVGEDEFFQKVQAAGGMLNGGTSNDQTIYFEVVPNNALEMALWLESDRMGYLLPTVTTEAFLNQQGVVQNEKRQNYDNRPYGHTNYVIGKLLYPEGHPYNWQVIGSFEDLANATVEDVRNFFRTWYGPNNATLVIAGDYDEAQAREWVDKYFGEIPPSDPVTDPDPRPVQLTETKRAFHEDNFARSPELNMVFPTVPRYTEDELPLLLFGELFSFGKDAPLYKVIVEEEKLAPAASAFNGSQEITGEFQITVRAFPGTSLSEVEDAIHAAFCRYEEEGFSEEYLDRVKATVETGFYGGLAGILGKSNLLAAFAEFAGSPGYIEEYIQELLSLTPDDLVRVYNTYIKAKPYVLTSFVPRGQADLAAEGSERFVIPEVPAGLVSAAAGMEVPAVEPLPSSFDRSVEPTKGPVPSVTIPTVWTHTYANGLRIYGIEKPEVPLVDFALTLEGGMLQDDPDMVGVANLITDVMMEGTAGKTPLELEEAIEGLGAYINMVTGRQSITMSGTGLKSKAREMMELAREILLEPRWDETEFPRIKDQTIETLNRRSADPAAVATNVFGTLVYGENSLLGQTTLGTPETVEAITMEDLKNYYSTHFSPSVSYIAIAGDITQAEAVELFRPLEESWPAADVPEISYPEPEPQPGTALYFVDIPGSQQSVVYAGHLALPRTHPEYFANTVMNHHLGGSFNGILNMILREEKGFTYGARSRFGGGLYPGTFSASSSVMSSATRETVEIVRDEIARYREGISQEGLDFTKDALTLSNTQRFETTPALLGMLGQIATYDLPFDYVANEEAIIREMTLDRHRKLAQQYLDPDRMIYLVVGDAATQFDALRGLGLGDPILLDVNGRRIQ
ncbi:MAG: insulinase family protein [Gemmatimonadetes bacterium]|nr:insulinase family protein [Gemmatimonadota bacterium]